jgi:hypothetical protein
MIQENLATERDMAAAAAAEAIKVSKELAKVKEHSLIAVAEAQNRNQEVQQCLERETSKLLNAMSAVHKKNMWHHLLLQKLLHLHSGPNKFWLSFWVPSTQKWQKLRS